jgi:hypothetical protein
MGMTVTETMEQPLWFVVAPPGLKAIVKHVDQGGVSYCNPADKALSEKKGRRKKHWGDHCANGVAKKNKPSASWDTTGDCIMWGAGDDTRTAFCPNCLAILKARKLIDIHSDFDGARAAEDC